MEGRSPGKLRRQKCREFPRLQPGAKSRYENVAVDDAPRNQLSLGRCRRRPPARMSKLILLSLLIAMIGIPARAAREKNSRKALRKVIVQTLIFEIFYLFALRYLYGRFG
jgi:hypothetical protein